VLSDWLFTARWAQRLNTGEALDAMISGYLHK
jgi:hypothetical protein